MNKQTGVHIGHTNQMISWFDDNDEFKVWNNYQYTLW